MNYPNHDKPSRLRDDPDPAHRSQLDTTIFQYNRAGGRRFAEALAASGGSFEDSAVAQLANRRGRLPPPTSYVERYSPLWAGARKL